MDKFEYRMKQIDEQLDRVVTAPKGDYDGLIAAIQHLVGIVNDQQSRIEQLETQLEEHEAGGYKNTR